MTDFELIKEALRARTMAYTPYSHHKVGAALLCADGNVVKGCNIENAGYTPSNCAERTAIFKAVSEGATNFTKIAIVGGMDNQNTLDICAPCGVCRQVLREFVDPKKFIVLLARVEGALDVETVTENNVSIKPMTLEELLPLGFGPENLIK